MKRHQYLDLELLSDFFFSFRLCLHETDLSVSFITNHAHIIAVISRFVLTVLGIVYIIVIR